MRDDAQKVMKKVLDFGPNQNGDFILMTQFFENSGLFGSKGKAVRKYMEQSGYVSGKPLRLTPTGIELANQRTSLAIISKCKDILSPVIFFIKLILDFCRLKDL